MGVLLRVERRRKQADVGDDHGGLRGLLLLLGLHHAWLVLIVRAVVGYDNGRRWRDGPLVTSVFPLHLG